MTRKKDIDQDALVLTQTKPKTKTLASTNTIHETSSSFECKH